MSEVNSFQKEAFLPAPFWVLWSLELWERFGYYGVQAIVAIFFVKELGLSQLEATYVFGSFAALVYGTPIIGGWLGDSILGAKRTLAIGMFFLFTSYTCLTFSESIAGSLNISYSSIVVYSLSGIAVGTGLFKANPTSLISKLYEQGSSKLDGAMTLYYMAVNIGSTISIALTPWIAEKYGYFTAFGICSVGMLFGIIGYFLFYSKISHISTAAGRKPFNWLHTILVILGSINIIILFGSILRNTTVVNIVVIIIVLLALFYYVFQMSKQDKSSRVKMIIALVLLGQAIIFFTLYQQMPTSLNFFALNNVNPHFLGLDIIAEQWQVLNPLVIILFAPFLAIIFKKYPGTHATKFCIGMSLCAIAFVFLYFSRYFASTEGLVSGWWLVGTYFFQSLGEIFISALGLSMVAALLPKTMSGFAMGMWFITTMISGPLGGLVGGLTAPPEGVELTKLESLHQYTFVFLEIGLFVTIVAILMWLFRGYLNKVLLSTQESVKDIDVI